MDISLISRRSKETTRDIPAVIYVGRVSYSIVLFELLGMGLLFPWWAVPLVFYWHGWEPFVSLLGILALIGSLIGPVMIARSLWFLVHRDPLVLVTEEGLYDRRCSGPDGRMQLMPWTEIANVELSARFHWGIKIGTSLRLVFKRKNATPFNLNAVHRWFLFKTTRDEYLLNSIHFGVYEGELLDYIRRKIGAYRPSPHIAVGKRPRGGWTEDHNALLSAISEVGADPDAGRYKINQILERGLDMNAKDKNGWTVLATARYHESPAWIISLLKDHGALEEQLGSR